LFPFVLIVRLTPRLTGDGLEAQRRGPHPHAAACYMMFFKVIQNSFKSNSSIGLIKPDWKAEKMAKRPVNISIQF
jgi:hypothetical protein